MPASSSQKSFQSFLDDLKNKYESETQFQPVEVELEADKLSDENFDVLLAFLKEKRKRFFIFKLNPVNEETKEKTEYLAFISRRAILAQTADEHLKNNGAPKLNPLKHALNDAVTSIRAPIQVQKPFLLPKESKQATPQDTPRTLKETQTSDSPRQERLPIKLSFNQLPALKQQLEALGVHYAENDAIKKINEYAYVFIDGMVPNNLPTGFYIDGNTLRYTDKPRHIPSALAPVLTNSKAFFPEEDQALLFLDEQLDDETVKNLYDESIETQQLALINGSAEHQKQLSKLFEDWSEEQKAYLIPLLSELYIVGGPKHAFAFAQTLSYFPSKNLSLDFLKAEGTKQAFLSSPLGIKNLSKLTKLSVEQRAWWESLMANHLQTNTPVDFNHFFNAFVNIFLPKVKELKLTLPKPCPINHEGPFLTTLNRVFDVLTQADDPNEQCQYLSNLDWGPTGVHYAMKSARPAFKFVCEEMALNASDAKDALTQAYRTMGQHWPKGFKLKTLKHLFELIQNHHQWSEIERQYLLAIFSSTAIAIKSDENTSDLEETLKQCIDTLNKVEQTDRAVLLQALTSCSSFRPAYTLKQVLVFIKQSLELKAKNKTLDFKKDIVQPQINCLQQEGTSLFERSETRSQKLNRSVSSDILDLTALLEINRNALIENLPLYIKRKKEYERATSLLEPIAPQHLKPIYGQSDEYEALINVFAALSDEKITEAIFQNFITAIKEATTKKGEAYCHALILSLGQLNLSKSTALPSSEQILNLIGTLSSADDIFPEEATPEEQEAWFFTQIDLSGQATGLVFGNGDISRLDDLIVDGLAESIKKRQALFNRVDEFKTIIKELLDMAPDSVNKKLSPIIMNLIDSIGDLFKQLQVENPKFEEIIKGFKAFEDAKPQLLTPLSIPIPFIPRPINAHGIHLLSLILTGELGDRSIQPVPLIGLPSIINSVVHKPLMKTIEEFFKQNTLPVKDLDYQKTLAWFSAFNKTHSLLFFFQEELVDKKVLPAIKKVLRQLNIKDEAFETRYLEKAKDFPNTGLTHEVLLSYKAKIQGIADYLNLLLKLKQTLGDGFDSFFDQLENASLKRVAEAQKIELINLLIQNTAKEEVETYLTLTTQTLDLFPEASDEAIKRAIKGLIQLMQLPDLTPATRMQFYKIILRHNLNSASAFPLDELLSVKQTPVAEQVQSQLLQQFIGILSQATNNEQPEKMKTLITHMVKFLDANPSLAPFCQSLLKHIPKGQMDSNMESAVRLLKDLKINDKAVIKRITSIISQLANNKKDTQLNVPLLAEITTNLVSHPNYLDKVEALFSIPPYPIASTLNEALLTPGEATLNEYCKQFDLNPFGKLNEKRDLVTQFATNRVQEALLHLEDLTQNSPLPHEKQIHLARQLTYIETLGYTDPLNPSAQDELQKLTASSRADLQEQASGLLIALRECNSRQAPTTQTEPLKLKLLAYLREIYYRTTGLFPNTTQMLTLLLSESESYAHSNLLMRIKTGEGKSLITPMLALLQWTRGGTVDVCTANRTLLHRDFEQNGQAFFNFFVNPSNNNSPLIRSSVIQADSPAEEYQLGGINYSTLEDMALFQLTAKEMKKSSMLRNDEPIHLVADESDDALLDQTTLYKLVSANAHAGVSIAWVYRLAYAFIRQTEFRLTQSNQAWDEDEDVDQFRNYLNKQITEQFAGDAQKQRFIDAASNTHLREWIDASCRAALLHENKHFIIQPLIDRDEEGNELKKQLICVPLSHSNPKPGCIFTDGVQEALQTRMSIENPQLASQFHIGSPPDVLASFSPYKLIQDYQSTEGRLVGISGTPGDRRELETLESRLNTKAIGLPPHAGDKRESLKAIHTFNFDETLNSIKKSIDKVKLPITKPTREINPNEVRQTYAEKTKHNEETDAAIELWNQTQTQPILIICEDFDEAEKIRQSLAPYEKEGFELQFVDGKNPEKDNDKIRRAGKANTITIGTAMLARGIDIDPGNHPKGLWVIQTYTDSERMTTQIAGRAARNGRPGAWQPIYRVTPPTHWFWRFLYFTLGLIIPPFRHYLDRKTIQSIQDKIKTQSIVDRTYTNAIDHIQQTLIGQVEAWEALILDLYPDDAETITQCYQWRSALLSEMNKFQSTHVNQETLDGSIAQFKTSICLYWENVKEKWVEKAKSASHINASNKAKLKILSGLALTQELNVQTGYRRRSETIKTSTEALAGKNLQATLLDKAGPTLSYEGERLEVDENKKEKEALQLAQSQQLLPQLIRELCADFAPAVRALDPTKIEEKSSNPIQRIIESGFSKLDELFMNKDKQLEISETYFTRYQEILLSVSKDKIHEILTQILPLMLDYGRSLEKADLKTRFKAQGTILLFMDLYRQSGLFEENCNLTAKNANNLKDLPLNIEKRMQQHVNLLALFRDNNDQIIKQLAKYLKEEFAWTQPGAIPLHSWFERECAIKAAKEIYNKATEILETKEEISVDMTQSLYQLLETHKQKLKGKFLLSLGHTNPKTVLDTALCAIDVLKVMPRGCDKAFREQCHDDTLRTHYSDEFRAKLNEQQPSLQNDAHSAQWKYINDTLKRILDTSKTAHLFDELFFRVKAFISDGAPKPIIKALEALKSRLIKISKHLQEKDGIIDKGKRLLFKEKASQFAGLFKVESENVEFKECNDGMTPYIEMRVKRQAPLAKFEGYHSPIEALLEEEEKQLLTKRQTLSEIRAQKGTLDSSISDSLSVQVLNEILQSDKTRKSIHLAASPAYQALLDSEAASLKAVSELTDEINKLEQSINNNKALFNQLEAALKEKETAYAQTSMLKTPLLYTQRYSEIKTSKAELKTYSDEIQSLEAQKAAQEAALQKTNTDLSECQAKIKIQAAKDTEPHIQSLYQAVDDELEQALDVVRKQKTIEAAKTSIQTKRFFDTQEVYAFYEESLRESGQKSNLGSLL